MAGEAVCGFLLGRPLLNFLTKAKSMGSGRLPGAHLSLDGVFVKIEEFTAADFFRKKYKDILNEDCLDYFFGIAKDIVRAGLESGEKYKTIESDCPWDSSGEIEKIYHSLNPGDYECVSDFLEELTGERIPTFESGCGWHFQTYSDLLDSAIEDFALKRRESFISGLTEAEVNLIKPGLDWPLGRDDEFDVFEALDLWFIEAEFRERIHEWISGAKVSSLIK